VLHLVIFFLEWNDKAGGWRLEAGKRRKSKNQIPNHNWVCSCSWGWGWGWKQKSPL